MAALLLPVDVIKTNNNSIIGLTIIKAKFGLMSM